MSADRISADRISDVTVLVVDDQRLVREGIASLLNIQEGIRVVGQAVNGQEAIEKALALCPDVILMDVRMPVVDGIVATAQIHRQLPGCQVIMLTTFDDEEYIVKSLRAGAVGYLLKDIPASQLARAVQLAHAGIYQLDPAVAGKLVGMLGSAQPERSPLPAPARTAAIENDLTERELEVLRLIGTGATNREIADRLVVSEGTVKNHVSSILSRLGLRDRTQAALLPTNMGLTLALAATTRTLLHSPIKVAQVPASGVRGEAFFWDGVGRLATPNAPSLNLPWQSPVNSAARGQGEVELAGAVAGTRDARAGASHHVEVVSRGVPDCAGIVVTHLGAGARKGHVGAQLHARGAGQEVS